MHTTAHRIAALSAAVLLPLVALPGCAQEPKRLSMDDARAMFASRGVQPGQPLPALSVTDLTGHAASVTALGGGRPMVLVTASLTCSVARAQQASVDDLRARYGDRIAVVVVYTIEAHPKGDACPYTGEEWVPKVNVSDAVLVRQPTTMAERLLLAGEYSARFASGATLVVDMMDNASWNALGQAPNLGLVIDDKGIVRSREGWFDAEATEAALANLGVSPNRPRAAAKPAAVPAR